MLLFFTFCFSLLQVTATATQGSSDQKICLRPEYLEETYYDKSLEAGRLDLRETNIYVYKEIFFKLPMVVLGWQITGKNGMLNGKGTERRGIVTEYTIKFLSQTSDWVFINNSKTGNEMFMSLGNLAIPNTMTKVILVNPITTMSLRLYPQIWEGIPYFKIKLRLCRPETMGYPSKLKDENTAGTSVTKLSDVKKFESKHHKKTRQKENSRKHKKVQPASCKTSPTWRYTKKSSPDDMFRATGDIRQAWRAMGNLRISPYTLSLKVKDKHNKIIKKIYLEVDFQNLTKIFRVRIGGSSNHERWGCVTKFDIMYKIEDQMNWVFYKDVYGAPRVFEMGERSQSDCDRENTFSLPEPIRTRAIRIYPKVWTHRPMLHVNFHTCNLEGINCTHPLLDRDLGHLQFGKLPGNLQDKNNMHYLKIHFSDHHLRKVKAVQFIQGPSYNGITKFVLQYQDEKEHWYPVNDAEGHIMEFSTADIVNKSKPMTVFLDSPLNIRSLRLYPQIWKGSSPMIQINFLGCRLKTHHKQNTLKNNLL